MGLDFSIHYVMHSLIEGKEVINKEIAYWRKAYGIRDRIVGYAMNNEQDIISSDDDYDFICHKEIIHDIVTRLVSELCTNNSQLWTNSVWSMITTKHETLLNLEKLVTLASFFELPLEGLTEEEIKKKYGREVTAAAHYLDISVKDLLLPILQPDNFEARIEIINNY